MRIAAKFAIALTSVFTAVLIAQAILHYHRVVTLHERETRDDLTILARALGNATTEIWQSSGKERAQAYVQQANQRRDRTRIRLREGDTGLSLLEPRRVDGQLEAQVPIQVGGATVAYIELRRSLARAASYRTGVIWTQIATTSALVLISAILAMLLGVWLIGRPVQRLIDQARQIARGDFELDLAPRRRDELGRLAAELDTMTRQLAQSREQLNEQRRTGAALREQLRHADRLSTVGKVASGIAHELGTPLNVVVGRATMVAGEATDDAIVHHAKIIAEQARRMTAIIQELLDFSSRRGVSKRRTRLQEVIAQATTLIEPIADSCGVEIVVQEAGELSAEIDVGKTLQVLTNLMMNGVQAMPEGGRLSIRAGSEHIEQPADDHAAAGLYISLQVADEGVGIAKEDLPHIFRPFFTTKRKGLGTGLGLYVCHGIVREQGGWIEVASKQGQGSLFTVFLPCDDTTGVMA